MISKTLVCWLSLWAFLTTSVFLSLVVVQGNFACVFFTTVLDIASEFLLEPMPSFTILSLGSGLPNRALFLRRRLLMDVYALWSFRTLWNRSS
jgi:hypothetical protein